MRRITPTAGSVTPEVEKIRGGTKVRMTIVIVLGSIVGILSVGIVILICTQPEIAKAYGSVLLQIISAFIFALVGFVAGQKLGSLD